MMPMVAYHDWRISCLMPHGWEVWRDGSNNILYQSPSDECRWGFIEIGGIRPNNPAGIAPAARQFMEQCYRTELERGEAFIEELKDGRVLVEYVEPTTHDGKLFLIYHFQLASASAHNTLRLVDFALAVEKDLKDTPETAELKEMVHQQAATAKINQW